MEFFVRLFRMVPTIALGMIMGLSSPAIAEDVTPTQILFTNVNVFDGFSSELHEGMDVLVEGNFIKEVDKNIEAPGAIVVDVE
ncbi:MAG: amidohydrolase family protein, partial [Acidobacteriota bacterium]